MISSAPLLVIRADADPETGTGHVMRCLALAQAWQAAGGTARFAFHDCPSGVVQRLREEGVNVVWISASPGSPADAAETAALAQLHDAAWVVVDGYRFGAEYQEALRDRGTPILFIDDWGHAAPYTADLVLNQNVYAEAGLYGNRARHTRLLLGPKFALIRREFREWLRWQRPMPERGRQILITFGGSDPQNLTLRSIIALDRLSDLEPEATVVVGSGNPHAGRIEEAAAARSRIMVHRDVRDMPALMASADIALTAGGSTCYETALMGLPSLVVSLAENQRPVAEGLAARGVLEYLGWHSDVDADRIAGGVRSLLLDHELRRTLSSAGQRLVPGDGADRSVSVMLGDAASASAPVVPGRHSPSRSA